MLVDRLLGWLVLVDWVSAFGKFVNGSRKLYFAERTSSRMARQYLLIILDMIDGSQCWRLLTGVSLLVLQDSLVSGLVFLDSTPTLYRQPPPLRQKAPASVGQLASCYFLLHQLPSVPFGDPSSPEANVSFPDDNNIEFEVERACFAYSRSFPATKKSTG